MNQVVRLPRSGFSRASLRDIVATSCDLPMLTGVVLSTMTPLLNRRGQTAVVERPAQPVIVRADVKLVASLLSVVLLETAGLSSAHATLRLAFDIDEGDAIVTAMGENIHHLALARTRIDPELADLAAEAGAELDLIWDENEGPTLVLRLPLRPRVRRH